MRSWSCACVVVVALAAAPAPAAAQLQAEVVLSGLDRPLALVPDPATPGVFFVVEQGGLVRTVRDGQLLGTPFLDLRGVVSSGGERGLLGLAFPPDAAASGRAFVNFTDVNGDTVVARYRRLAGDSLRLDPGSRFDLRWPDGQRVIRQPFSNHNGGHLVFGPDGFLYIGLGDGGSANDPNNAAQDPSTLLGKMLRIDVGVGDGDAAGYRVPPDNPFLDGQPVSAPGEVWAFGLRNPWRYSFDDVGGGATHALIVGDVGQNAREELDYEPAGAGGRNYGWRLREGRIATPGVPAGSPAFGPLVDPIHEYGHGEGRSITAGFVYRGSALPATFVGRYFFADFIRSRVWSAGLAIDPATREATVTDILEHTSELGGATQFGGIASFGRDRDGELYLVTFSGRLYKITAGVVVLPQPPWQVLASAAGHTVDVRWSPPTSGPPPAGYRLEAGSAPGAADLGVVDVEATRTSLSFQNVPAATYHLRMRSLGTTGAGAPTADTVLLVQGGCTAAPPAPSDLARVVSGRTVTFTWTLASTSNGATSFVLEAGSAPGASNLGALSTGGTSRSVSVTAPPGRYYVRLRAVNACGSSTGSSEVTVDVF